MKFGTSVFTKDTDDDQSKGIFGIDILIFRWKLLGGMEIKTNWSYMLREDDKDDIYNKNYSNLNILQYINYIIIEYMIWYH